MSGILGSSSIGTAEVLIAVIAATVSLATVVAMWRHPHRAATGSIATPALRSSLATHHAGHVVAQHLQQPDAIRRTGLSDDCTAGRSMTLPAPQTSLRNQLIILLSGLSAEEIFTGESGSYASDDLTSATRVGADMVGRYGMAGSLVSLATTKETAFIDKVLDDARTRKELEALLRDSKRDSMRLMLENRHLIIAVRDALLRREILSAAEIRRVITEAEARRHSDDEVLVDLRLAGERSRPILRASRG